METVKILHCADLHIGAAQFFLGEKGQSRKAEALLTFENIINLARDNEVKILLIAGDLLSSNSVSRAAVSRVLECISSVPDIKVVFAAGNHDPMNSESPFTVLNLPENFYILPDKDTEIYFPELNTRVFGRSFFDVYMSGEASFTLKAPEDSINIMCQHGELKSDLSSNYNSITQEFIENSGMDYIALGHIHKRSDICRAGNTFYAYSGCAEGLGFDEPGDKGVYIGEVGKGVCDLSFVKTSLRTHETVSVDVSACEDSAAAAVEAERVLKEKFSDNYTKNLYKIVLKGDVPEGRIYDTAEIASRLNQTVYFAKVKDETEVLSDLELLRHENSLKGIFVDKMLLRIAENPDDSTLKTALNIGLKAFSSEVGYNENQ